VEKARETQRRATDVAFTRLTFAWVAAAFVLLTPTGARGQAVSLLGDSTHLKIFANISALGVVSTERPFAPGIPFLLLPESPFGFHTNTFDLHARQSNFGLIFAGPKIKSFSTGATFLAFIAKDNLVADSYGLLPFLAFGELRNEHWLFTAGLNLDVFNPLNPTIIPISVLYGSGNTGEYRGQVRVERYFDPSADSHVAIQFAVGEPVATVVTDNRLLLEDNGWPNLELRFSFGGGEVKERMGGRKLRTLQLGLSGVIGQLRTTGIITSPGQAESPNRNIVDVRGFGLDAQLAFNKWLGLFGEFYFGDGLGEYGGALLQSFNSITFDVIPSRGGFAEAYAYFDDKRHLHGGYGIDDPNDDDLAILQIPKNQTGYGVLYWEVSRILQLGLEVEYRKTNFFPPLLTADGMIFMTQFLFRF
jgi:hypothetical protein